MKHFILQTFSTYHCTTSLKVQSSLKTKPIYLLKVLVQMAVVAQESRDKGLGIRIRFYGC